MQRRRKRRKVESEKGKKGGKERRKGEKQERKGGRVERETCKKNNDEDSTALGRSHAKLFTCVEDRHCQERITSS